MGTTAEDESEHITRAVLTMIHERKVPTFLIDEEKMMLFIRSTCIFQLKNDENLNVIKSTYVKRNCA